MSMTMFVTIGIIAVVVLVLINQAVRIVQEYERGVIFRLGRIVAARGPGLFFLIPFVETMRKVDLRIVTLEVPAQEAITRDNVTIQVDAVVYFRVVTRAKPSSKPSILCARPRWSDRRRCAASSASRTWTIC